VRPKTAINSPFKKHGIKDKKEERVRAQVA